jgi:hypothetical protein
VATSESKRLFCSTYQLAVSSIVSLRENSASVAAFSTAPAVLLAMEGKSYDPSEIEESSITLPVSTDVYQCKGHHADPSTVRRSSRSSCMPTVTQSVRTPADVTGLVPYQEIHHSRRGLLRFLCRCATSALQFGWSLPVGRTVSQDSRRFIL